MISTSPGKLQAGSRELWVLSAFAWLLPASLFVVAGVFYSSPDFLDRRYRTLFADEIIWLWILFGLPLIVQAIIMLSLLRRALKDKAANQFYWLCLVTMGVGSFGYCFLWLLYTIGLQNRGFLSFVALIIIIALVGVVCYVTYLIMSSPKPSPPAHLAEDDIRLTRGTLCSSLYAAKVKDEPSYLVRVFDVLGQAGVMPFDDLESSVRAAASAGQFETVNVSAIVKHLNEEVIEKDFFQSTHIVEIPASDDTKRTWYALHDGPSKFPSAERRRLSRIVNRLLLECCFGGNAIKPFPGELVPSKTRVFEMELREGLTQAPFGALVFFFTIFLVISYLFAFCFAFDDKAHLESSGRPALFMERTHASGVVNNETSTDPNQLQSVARYSSVTPIAPWPSYGLYLRHDGSSLVSEGKHFDSNGFDDALQKRSELRKKKEELEKSIQLHRHQVTTSYGSLPKKMPKTYDKDLQAAYGTWQQDAQALGSNQRELSTIETELANQIEAWIAAQNRDHLFRVLRVIENEAAQKRGVLLEVTTVPQSPPSGDSSGPGKPLKAAVPSVSAEVVEQSIKSLLTVRLAETGTTPHNIEWFDPPPRLNLTATSPGQPDSGSVGEDWESLTTKDPLAQLKQSNSVLQDELTRITNIKEQLSEEDHKVLDNRFAEIARIAQKEEWKQEKHIVQDKLTDSLMMLREVRQSIEMRGIKAPVYHKVAISLRPLPDKHSFIPLSLMDYIYFTVYTITTTGYGDIIPTTTYAKFLCTFANILEVFFLVVFFNSLLSAKKRYRLSPS